MARPSIKPPTQRPDPGERNWRLDKLRGYVAHYIPPIEVVLDATANPPIVETISEGRWEGPADAYVWFGLPYEGNPLVTHTIDATGRRVDVPAYVNSDLLSAEIGGVKVEWVDWDEQTRCNVYRRVYDA